MARNTNVKRYSAHWRYDQQPYDPANTKSVGWWLDAKIKSWITAVNANPSNAVKQVTLHEDATGNDGDTLGWVIQFMNDPYLAVDAQSIYMQTSFKNTASGTTGNVGGTYTPGSYLGTIGGGNSQLATDVMNRPSVSSERDTWMDVYMGTDDGQEFFWAVTSYGTNNSNKWGMYMYKDTRGYWLAGIQDESVLTGCAYYINRHTSTGNRYGTGRVHRGGLYSNASQGSWLRGPFLFGPDDNQIITSSMCTQWWRDAAGVAYYDDSGFAPITALTEPNSTSGLRHHFVSEVSVVADFA